MDWMKPQFPDAKPSQLLAVTIPIAEIAEVLTIVTAYELLDDYPIPELAQPVPVLDQLTLVIDPDKFDVSLGRKDRAPVPLNRLIGFEYSWERDVPN